MTDDDFLNEAERLIYLPDRNVGDENAAIALALIDIGHSLRSQQERLNQLQAQSAPRSERHLYQQRSSNESDND